jgi:succinate dehydrogenase/fumarate reductase flavoprotein subunit
MTFRMEEEIAETDVLCIGGGIAGLMAAYRASELGLKVLVADKENTLYSGAAGGGNDHFLCYIPEFHGPDIEPLIEEFKISLLGRLWPNKFIRLWLERSFDMVKLWESWGIPMKYKGKYEFAGHAFPGRPLPRLHYSGKGQKKIMTEQVLKKGAKIMNRMMVFDLVHDDGLLGAVGLSTREGKIFGIKAKSIVLATGHLNRLYPSPTPGWMANVDMPFNLTGDGRAMAYRAGAKLFNMEIPKYWAGLKYFVRSGKGSWMGVYRDPQGKPIGPFVTKPEMRTGDATGDVAPTIYRDYATSGRGPVYMDCRGQTEEEYRYMMYWLGQEGGAATLNYMLEEGIDLRKNPVEWMSYSMFPIGGVYYNEKGETSLKGLYACGMETFMDLSGSAIFGYIAGENAAKYAKGASSLKSDKLNSTLKKKRILLEDIRRRETGAGWKEANIALQQLMTDHAGAVRSGTMIDAGLRHLERLRGKVYDTIMANSQHELWRSMEVINLLDLAEVVFRTSEERKETRGMFIRTDYPITNPLLDRILVVRRENEKPIFEWRKVEEG